MIYMGSQASLVDPIAEHFCCRKCDSSDIVKQSEVILSGGRSAVETMRGMADAPSLNEDGYGSCEIPAGNNVTVTFGDFAPLNLLTSSPQQVGQGFFHCGLSNRLELGQPIKLLDQRLDTGVTCPLRFKSLLPQTHMPLKWKGMKLTKLAGTLPDDTGADGDGIKGMIRPHHQRHNLPVSLMDGGIGLGGVGNMANLRF